MAIKLTPTGNIPQSSLTPSTPAQSYPLQIQMTGQGGPAQWGNISGTLSDQTDLQNALNAKMDKSGGTFTGDVTLGSGVSLKTTNGQLHEVNNKIVLGDNSNNGLYVNPNGQTAALINGTTVKNIITSSDVKSTYSSTGLDPVNGTAVNSALSGINALIPAQATTSNQLADKNFVNSSIATNTANFIGTFNSVADLEAYSGTLTNNDYAFVVGVDSDGNTVYNRYKYTNATDPAEWAFEYALNNSSFTAAQWASINSGITDTAVTQIGTNTTNIGTLTTDKQPKTLATPITVEGTPQTTVEGALGAINTFAGKSLQNKATVDSTISIETETAKTNSLSIGKSISEIGNSSVNLGNYTYTGNSSVAVGYKANANTAFAIAIGSSGSSTEYTAASGLFSVAIGYNARATAQGSIQIGQGTNSTANTMQVLSHQLLDANGKIPNERLPYATSSKVGGVRISIDANNVVTIYTGD